VEWFRSPVQKDPTIPQYRTRQEMLEEVLSVRHALQRWEAGDDAFLAEQNLEGAQKMLERSRAQTPTDFIFKVRVGRSRHERHEDLPPVVG
jgi:hypothetical protein